jgi:hypothetical protein
MVCELTRWSSFASAFVPASLWPGGPQTVLYPAARQRPCVPGCFSSSPRSATRPVCSRAGIGLASAPGRPLLSLSWFPCVRDPLGFAAGWLRMPLARRTFIAAGKAARDALVGAAPEAVGHIAAQESALL